MATNKPRITLSLEPHVYEVLRRMSAAGGNSMSSIVTGFLDVAVPALERMVVVMEAAKAAPEQTMQEVSDMVARAEARVLPAVAALADQADLFLAQEAALHRSRQAGAEGARQAVSGGSTPVPVTRGSGTAKGRKSGVKHGRL